jgi:hypothetical protein
MTDKQILLKFIRFFMSRNTTPGLPQGRSGGPEVCTNSMRKFVAGYLRSRIIGASIVWTSQPQKPCSYAAARIYILKIFRDYTPDPFLQWVEGMRRVTVERGGLGGEKNV